MSQDQPPSPGSFEFPPVSPQVLEERYRWVQPPPIPRPAKFQHRLRPHVLLFALTLLTTSMAGGCHYLGFLASTGAPTGVEPVGTLTGLVGFLLSPAYLLPGLWYAVPLLLILGAHEFGHYYYCRVHDVDATLPYFLPAPLPLTGTLGAVIRIREAFPSKKALFDIGVAGPIAGFVVMVPFLYFGMQLSAQVHFPQSDDVIYFGEPLLLKAFAWLRFGALKEGYDITLHPMGFAAWFGMLATALNLLPFGQLDGGHIAYAVLGRRAAYVSVATLGVAVALTIGSASWLAVTVMMLAMAFFLGVRHPTIVDEDTPLDSTRLWVAAFALLMFILCFTPVPIDMLVSRS
ncbi:MAG: site-2 protease family protein [Vicinamibacterales bacterium]